MIRLVKFMVNESRSRESKEKKFLKQLKKLDKLIENKLAEKAQWKSIATGTTIQLNEKVQSSGNQQKMADAVGEYIDMEREINAYIDILIAKKKDVISVIEQLNATEYDILHKVYVQYLTLYDVADIYEKSYSWVTSVHGRALANVRKILDERNVIDEFIL